MDSDIGVQEDPALLGDEKETLLRFGRGDDTAEVFSEERAVMNPLLENPEFEPTNLRTLDGDTVTPDEHDGEVVVAVWGEVPIGALKVKGSSRSNNYHSGIVSPGITEEEREQLQNL